MRLLRVNRVLVDRMRRLGAFSKPLILAIDWHDEMYYGDPGADGVVGTRPKKGSHYAYRFASASVVVDGERLTIAVTPLLSEPIDRYMERLTSLSRNELNRYSRFKRMLKTKAEQLGMKFYNEDLALAYLDEGEIADNV